MTLIEHVAKSAPEIFLFVAIALGTLLGRVRIRGFALGATACILLVSVILGQLGTIVIPPILRSVFFGFFVFTIGYRSGPEFFASLSIRTLAQVVLALFIGATGLVAVLIFAYLLHLDAGTAAGLAAGALTQSSIIGTSVGALGQLGLSTEAFNQQQAQCRCRLRRDLHQRLHPRSAVRAVRRALADGRESQGRSGKARSSLSGGRTASRSNLAYRKFQVRAYRVSTAAGRAVREIEQAIGRRTVIERISRKGGSR